MQSSRGILTAVAALILVGCGAAPGSPVGPSGEGRGLLGVIARYQDPPPGTAISIGGYGVFADLRGPSGFVAENVELDLFGLVELAQDVPAGDYRLVIRVRPASDAIANGVRTFGPVMATCDDFVPVLAGGTTGVVVTVVGGESCAIERANAALTTTLSPASGRGAEIGVPRAFAMQHCGIHSPIDFDGSFWDPILPVPAPLAFDNAAGFIRLAEGNTAVFVGEDGHQLIMLRHDGDKAFLLCD